MSKKSSSKGKISSKASITPLISEDETELISLKEEAKKLHLKAKIEELDFNEFQSQRKKIHYFWLLEKDSLERKQADVRVKDREIRDLVEQHLFEIKSCQDNLKSLLHKQQTQFADKLTNIMSSQKDSLQSYMVTLKHQKLNNLEVEALLRASSDEHNVVLRSMRREHEAAVTCLRNEFEKKAEELRLSYDLQLHRQREEADKRRRFELKQIKDDKVEMVTCLLAQHKHAFDDIKISHHGTIFDNLDMIKTLKAELTSVEEEEVQDQMKISEYETQINRIAGPLQRLQVNNRNSTSASESYQQEKVGMRRVGESVKKLEKELEALSWEHESLLQKVITQKTDRDALKQTLTRAVYDIKQKTSFRTLLLEKKLKSIKATAILPEISHSASTSNQINV